jgi:hypothetical protein
MGHHMMLDPSFCRLFPGSALLVSVDDETSCAIVCKCAVLIGLWRRMGRPVTFLRRPPMRWAGGPMKPMFSDDSEPIIDHSETRPRGHRIYRDLSSATTSVTLAGSGLHDVLLDAALAANSARIPVIVVADAVQGLPLHLGQSEEHIFSLLEQFAWLLPMATLMPAGES